MLLSHCRDTDGGMLLDIFDEKLHPLSVRSLTSLLSEMKLVCILTEAELSFFLLFKILIWFESSLLFSALIPPFFSFIPFVNLYFISSPFLFLSLLCIQLFSKFPLPPSPPLPISSTPPWPPHFPFLSSSSPLLPSFQTEIGRAAGLRPTRPGAAADLPVRQDVVQLRSAHG